MLPLLAMHSSRCGLLWCRPAHGVDCLVRHPQISRPDGLGACHVWYIAERSRHSDALDFATYEQRVRIIMRRGCHFLRQGFGQRLDSQAPCPLVEIDLHVAFSSFTSTGSRLSNSASSASSAVEKAMNFAMASSGLEASMMRVPDIE